MGEKTFSYAFEWDLRARPEELWPLVSDTNRFNSEIGMARIRIVPNVPGLPDGWTRLNDRVGPFVIEIDEEPFQWLAPFRFGVRRHFRNGPLKTIVVRVSLQPKETGGTHLVYRLDVTARNVLGKLVVPGTVRKLHRQFDRVFTEFDQRITTAQQTARPVEAVGGKNKPKLLPDAEARLERAKRAMVAAGADPGITARLIETIRTDDEMTAHKLRPFALADRWNVPRRRVLETCLFGTRHSLLELQWDLMCPLCRGAKASVLALAEVNQQVHCDSCHIDYTANFDRSVEITFKPNPLIREIEFVEYCTGGPNRTPHAVAQEILAPGATIELQTALEPGRYRIRARQVPGGMSLFVARPAEEAEAATDLAVEVSSSAGWSSAEPTIRASAPIRVTNADAQDRVVIVERMRWADQIATAADVTILQTFRDLFADEALRPGDQISVGSVTILFTDLKGSTQMYREIGDAEAFGLVMKHFDVLRAAIDAESGAIVKTIGDAVMAAFRRPAAAMRAILGAQRVLMNPTDGAKPLTLKAGLHHGPCIAVTLNDRLDYFGSTVNQAARLEGLSTGGNIVISDTVYDDPEVRDLLDRRHEFAAEPFATQLKGFEDEQFGLYRISIHETIASDRKRLRETGVWVPPT